MQYTICNIQYTTCNIQYAIYNMQYTICNMQYTVYIQYIIYNMQIQYTHYVPFTYILTSLFHDQFRLGRRPPKTNQMTSTTKTPKLKPKPPPLTLHPNPHNWLLNPLAEFAAIATSPQSPLVQQTTCGGGVYDVTSRDQDSTSLSSLVIISRAMFGQVKRGMSSLKHAFLFPNFRLH